MKKENNATLKSSSKKYMLAADVSFMAKILLVGIGGLVALVTKNHIVGGSIAAGGLVLGSAAESFFTKKSSEIIIREAKRRGSSPIKTTTSNEENIEI